LEIPPAYSCSFRIFCDARSLNELGGPTQIEKFTRTNSPNDCDRAKNSDACALLLIHNADPNLSDSKWDTPLHIACYDGDLEYAILLSELMTTVERKNKQGNTPLLIASEKGHDLIVRQLVDCNPEGVNTQGARGNTALHHACEKKNTLLVSFLLQNGAHPNLQNIRGDTPFHIACRTGNQLLAREILLQGADKTLRNSLGETPIDLAHRYLPERVAREFDRTLSILDR
jgi:ankyrin repeat protein